MGTVDGRKEAIMPRSPNSPSVDLSIAAEYVQGIHKKEGKSEMTSEAVVKAMGYNSLNGKARSVLGALRQYGLLDFSKGRGILSQRGLAIAVMPESTSEYRQALKEAALEPPLFSELYQTKRDASADNIVSHLQLYKEFTQEGAERAAKIFRATIRLANLDDSDNISGQEGGYYVDDSDYEDAQMSDKPQTQTIHPNPIQVRTSIPQPSVAHTYDYGWQLSKDMKAQVLFQGEIIRPKDIEMLCRYLELMKESLEEQQGENDEETQVDTIE